MRALHAPLTPPACREEDHDLDIFRAAASGQEVPIQDLPESQTPEFPASELTPVTSESRALQVLVHVARRNEERAGLAPSCTI